MIYYFYTNYLKKLFLGCNLSAWEIVCRGKHFRRKKCQILPDEIFPDKVSAQLHNGMNYFIGYVNVWRYEFLYTIFSLEFKPAITASRQCKGILCFWLSEDTDEADNEIDLLIPCKKK